MVVLFDWLIETNHFLTRRLNRIVHELRSKRHFQPMSSLIENFLLPIGDGRVRFPFRSCDEEFLKAAKHTSRNIAASFRLIVSLFWPLVK